MASHHHRPTREAQSDSDPARDAVKFGVRWLWFDSTTAAFHEGRFHLKSLQLFCNFVCWVANGGGWLMTVVDDGDDARKALGIANVVENPSMGVDA